MKILHKNGNILLKSSLSFIFIFIQDFVPYIIFSLEIFHVPRGIQVNVSFKFLLYLFDNRFKVRADIASNYKYN